MVFKTAFQEGYTHLNPLQRVRYVVENCVSSVYCVFFEKNAVFMGVQREIVAFSPCFYEGDITFYPGMVAIETYQEMMISP